MSKTAATYKATVETPHGPRTCFEVRVERSGRQPQVARFGGILLARRKDAALVDRVPKPVIYPVKGLTVRLRTGRCELCEQPGPVHVHQVANLAQLGQPGPGQPAWAARMARMRRKTLVVWRPGHRAIHDQQPTTNAA